MELVSGRTLQQTVAELEPLPAEEASRSSCQGIGRFALDAFQSRPFRRMITQATQCLVATVRDASSSEEVEQGPIEHGGLH